MFFEADSRNTLILLGEYLHTDLNGVDRGAGGALFDRTQLQEQGRATLEHRLQATKTFKLVSRATYSQFREQYLLDQRNGTALDQYEDNREQLGQITSIATFEPAAAHRTTLGAEELFQGLDSSRLSRPGQRFRFGAFAQHAWSPIDDDERALQITPGVRLDADSQFGSQISPKLALRYQPLSYLEFRASYGRGFRAPTFQEQLLRFENPSAGYVVIGNPNLRAETSHGFDGGARLFNELFELSAGFFRNDLRNMITYEMQGGGAGTATYVYENLTHAWTMGIETAATVHVEDTAQLMLGYTWLDTWDGENQRQLEGRPRHRFTANMRFMLPWQIEVVGRSALSLGRVFYVDDSDGSGHQHAVHPRPLAQVDARIAKHFDPYLEVFIGADNIFDAGDPYTAILPFTVYGGARGKYY